MKKILKISLVTATLLPLLAFAQQGIVPREPLPDPNLFTIINRVSNWILGLLIALSVLFVMYAAYLYLTAAGDEENLKTAKNILIYAAVAIGLGLLAKLISLLVTQLVA